MHGDLINVSYNPLDSQFRKFYQIEDKSDKNFDKLKVFTEKRLRMASMTCLAVWGIIVHTGNALGKTLLLPGIVVIHLCTLDSSEIFPRIKEIALHALSALKMVGATFACFIGIAFPSATVFVLRELELDPIKLDRKKKIKNMLAKVKLAGEIASKAHRAMDAVIQMSEEEEKETPLDIKRVRAVLEQAEEALRTAKDTEKEVASAKISNEEIKKIIAELEEKVNEYRGNARVQQIKGAEKVSDFVDMLQKRFSEDLELGWKASSNVHSMHDVDIVLLGEIHEQEPVLRCNRVALEALRGLQSTFCAETYKESSPDRIKKYMQMHLGVKEVPVMDCVGWDIDTSQLHSHFVTIDLLHKFLSDQLALWKNKQLTVREAYEEIHKASEIFIEELKKLDFVKKKASRIVEGVNHKQLGSIISLKSCEDLAGMIIDDILIMALIDLNLARQNSLVETIQSVLKKTKAVKQHNPAFVFAGFRHFVNEDKIEPVLNKFLQSENVRYLVLWPKKLHKEIELNARASYYGKLKEIPKLANELRSFERVFPTTLH